MKSDYRRRRLRVIKTVQDRSEKQQCRAAVLAIAAETAESRSEMEELRRQLFAECAGNPAALLRIERPDEPPISVVMDRPFLLIGRDADCDVSLDYDEIKPRHCLLQWVDGQLFCGDVAQRTSLFPDRQGQPGGRWVDGHQPIAIGPCRLLLTDDVAAVPHHYSPLDRSPLLAAEYPHLGLQFTGVEQANNIWPVNRMLTLIGRGSQCKLRLNHKSIAHVQACLVRTPVACWLIDLVNDGTTGVNGQAIRLSSVDIGDTLQLGSFQVDVVTTAFQPVIPTPGSGIVPGRSLAADLPPLRFARSPVPHVEPAAELPAPVAPDLPHPLQVTIDSRLVKGFPAELVESNGSSAPNMAVEERVSASDSGGVATYPRVDSVALTESLSQFAQQQQSQLDTLKQRLNELKQIYETAAQNLISKRMRDSLEAPVIETLQCHDEMQESLNQFIQLIDRQSE